MSFTLLRVSGIEINQKINSESAETLASTSGRMTPIVRNNGPRIYAEEGRRIGGSFNRVLSRCPEAISRAKNICSTDMFSQFANKPSNTGESRPSLILLVFCGIQRIEWMPLISVLMPVDNCDEHVHAAINSILTQTFSRFRTHHH